MDPNGSYGPPPNGPIRVRSAVGEDTKVTFAFHQQASLAAGHRWYFRTENARHWSFAGTNSTVTGLLPETVTWRDDAADESGSRVWHSAQASPATILGPHSGGTMSHPFTGLASDKNYAFSIAALKNGAQETLTSVTATTLPATLADLRPRWSVRRRYSLRRSYLQRWRSADGPADGAAWAIVDLQ
jgi:hypothetical protein